MADPRDPGRILDLTHPLAPGMPFYPGTEPPTFSRAFTVEAHGFAEQRLTLLTHTGTHLDAPAHMLAGGATLDRFPAGHFLGRAAVVEASGAAAGRIARDDLAAQLPDLDSLQYVLLHTGWASRWGRDDYDEGFPVLDEDAARWLAAGGLRGVGIDAVSVDAAGSDSFPVHRILLGGGLVIVENLTGLGPLAGLRLQFCCLPLRIAGADGSPARAIAWTD